MNGAFVSKLLAVVSGSILTGLYILGTSGGGHIGQKIVIGVLFGIAVSLNMIHRPERTTRKTTLFLTAPLLIVLIIVVALTGSRMDLIITAVGALAFFVVQLAFTAVTPKP